ncbi:MAG: hypothetical protein NC341_04815 [Blautia sp.]|nr:hypothetical protein [Blautia sp.]MCM1200958.1 hypothetical protein [Bacteroides fragilis]
MLCDVISQKRVWTIWFLACLTITEIIAYLMYRILKKISYQYIGAILSLLIGLVYAKVINRPLVWNTDIALVAVFYFTNGRIFAYYHCAELMRNCKQRVIYAGVCFLLVEIIRRANEVLGGGFLNMGGGNYRIEWLTIPASLIGIGGILWISMKWEKFSLFALTGRNSLYIFAWHNIIFRPLIEKIFCLSGIDNMSLISIWVKIILAILFGILSGKLISKIKIMM